MAGKGAVTAAEDTIFKTREQRFPKAAQDFPRKAPRRVKTPPPCGFKAMDNPAPAR